MTATDSPVLADSPSPLTRKVSGLSASPTLTNSLDAANDSTSSPRPVLDAPELLAGEPANEPAARASEGAALLHALLADPATPRTLGRWLRRGVPAQELEGLVQDVCVEALAMTRVPADPEQLRPWLHGLARRVRADFLSARRRQQQRYVSDEDREDADLGPSPIHVRDRLRWVERKVERGELPREVLGAMLQPETGEQPRRAVATTPGAERVQVSRHRAKLRKQWEEEGSDPETSEHDERPSRARPKKRRG